MKKNDAPYVVPLCMLVIGLVFVVLGLNAQFKRQEMEKAGVSLTGTVMGGKLDRGSKGKTNYYLRVVWNEEGASPQDRLFLVKREFFTQHVEGTGYQEAENRVTAPEVPLRTLPGKPERAILVGGSGDVSGLRYLGYVLAGLGLYFLYRCYRRPRADLASG